MRNIPIFELKLIAPCPKVVQRKRKHEESESYSVTLNEVLSGVTSRFQIITPSSETEGVRLTCLLFFLVQLPIAR
ncbi:hypothetical protein TNCV_3632611 [Trichonephila clavipes]|nr:hypothetical protein TNCV_3632611 [Trichonephila clavipes]